MTKEEAKAKIEAQVQKFSEHGKEYHFTDYNETTTRRDFIDPFFMALGWDVANSEGVSEAYREVIHEDKVTIAGKVKAPDYGFRLNGSDKKRLFCVEAKKLAVLLKINKESAYQLRRYGRSAQAHVSILTNFEEFVVYDCSKRPNFNVSAAVARLKYIKYDEYSKDFLFRISPLNKKMKS